MKAFFAKVWNAIKGAFSKMWSWSLGHKAIAIAVAATVVVGTTCAVVLPMALHNHKFAEEWCSDAENHWHAATCKHSDEKGDLAAHTYDNACDTACNVCGATRSITHVFNVEAANTETLKAVATATTKAQYWKSCACGEISTTEYFETDKTVATITNLSMAGKTYDGTAISAPSYEKSSDGAVTVEYSVKDANAFTSTAPTSAGNYTVRVTVAETVTYTGVTKTADFTIAPKVIDANLFYQFAYNGDSVHFIEIPNTELAACDQDLLWFNFYFDGSNANATLESIEIVNDADQVNPNYAVGDQIGAEIIKKGLAGSSAYLDLYYGDLIEDPETAGVYYYDYVMTSEDNYGVIVGDEVTIRFYYSDVNAGSAPTDFEIINNNNYYDDDMGFNNTSVSAKILELPTSVTKTYDATGTVTLEFTGVAGETVVAVFDAVDSSDNKKINAGTYSDIGPKDPEFFVNDVATENYAFAMNGETFTLTIEKKEIRISTLYAKYTLPFDRTSIYVNAGSSIGVIESDAAANNVYVNITFTTAGFNSVKAAYAPGLVIDLTDSDIIASVLMGTGTPNSNYKIELENGAKLIIAEVQQRTPTSPETVTDPLVTENVGAGYEGGLYKVTVSGGRYGITLSDYDLAWNGCFYDENGNKYEAKSGTVDLEAGTYYFVITVPGGSLTSAQNFELMKFRTLPI